MSLINIVRNFNFIIICDIALKVFWFLILKTFVIFSFLVAINFPEKLIQLSLHLDLQLSVVSILINHLIVLKFFNFIIENELFWFNYGWISFFINFRILIFWFLSISCFFNNDVTYKCNLFQNLIIFWVEASIDDSLLIFWYGLRV